MKVSSEAEAKRHVPERSSVRIEFAIPSEGGNSSAGEKYDFPEKAVRLSWRSADGRFDPISSAEMPEWALLDVVEACAAKEFFSAHEAAVLISVLAESVKRQTAPST